MTVCKLCGSPAQFHAGEQVWRHKGNPMQGEYVGQLFCDGYGYPIPVKEAEGHE